MNRLTIVGLLLFVAVSQITAQTTAQAGLTITPGKLDFGQQDLNSASQAVTVTIRNPAISPVPIEEIIASGIDFISHSDCGNQLAPGAECAVQIQFKPAETGDRSGILEILAADSAKPYFVPLTGTGVSISPERPSAAGSLPSLDGNENASSKEKGQSPVKERGIRPSQRRKRRG